MRKEGSSLPIDVIPFGGRTQAGKKEPHHPSPLLPSHSPRPGEEKPSSPRPSSPAPSPPPTPGEEGEEHVHPRDRAPWERWRPAGCLPRFFERKAKLDAGGTPALPGAPAERSCFSPSSPGVGGWAGAGEEGRGDEDLGRGSSERGQFKEVHGAIQLSSRSRRRSVGDADVRFAGQEAQRLHPHGPAGAGESFGGA